MLYTRPWEPVRIGVIGAGYWGPKLVRNLVSAPGASVSWVADRVQSRLADIGSSFPHIRTTENYHDLLNDDDVDAIVLATPVTTHARIAREALLAGKTPRKIIVIPGKLVNFVVDGD